ncbi:hypothetical protein TNCV_1724241 [Trichonephila clavipes]|nr:hypothetical protein TNCV_1724241 [Trichonephila clavipes]
MDPRDAICTMNMLRNPRQTSHREDHHIASWASYEIERNRDTVAANMERNVSRHHTELECLNTQWYCVVHSR